MLQETTVCQQQQFRWTEVGPDNRQVSHSGHYISCEHFRRRDSLPKRDKQHCELEVTSLICTCELGKCSFVPIHIHIRLPRIHLMLYHCPMWLNDRIIIDWVDC